MTMRKITAGKNSSFAQLINNTTVYVDKTQPVCLMASQEDDILLTRPRRMGKSTLLSTLEYLFSKGTVGTKVSTATSIGLSLIAISSFTLTGVGLIYLQ